MKILHWLFPVGAILIIYGVLSLLLEAWSSSHGFWLPTDFDYVLGVTGSISLLGGPLLALAGAISDRLKLSVIKTKRRGRLCWLIGIACIIVMLTHHWGFDDPAILLIFPTFAAILGGITLSTKTG